MFSEVYLPESDLWVVGPPISIGNYFDNELASAGDYVYTVGGRTAPGATYNTTMRWDLKEPTPPSVAATDSPDPQIPGGTVWFNATALDNRGVASVWIRISYPNGSDMGNYSMTFNGAGGDWEYDAPFSGLGTYGYDVWAEDVSENWASFSGTFRIASSPDTQPPLVTNNRLNGSSSKTVVRGELVTVTAEVDDSTTGNSRIIEAWFTVDGGPSVRLFPTDGAFDSPTENVNATIDTSGWAVGAHAVCEFGKDEANNVGSVTSCNTLTVTVPAVNSPPVAAIAVTPSTTGFVDDVFTFNGSASSDPDGSIASWRWDFGDGFNAVGANVTHAFVAKLTFTVKLNVTDNLGAWDEATVQIVIVNRAPIIVMVSPGDSPVSLWAGNTQAFEVAAVDPDGDMLTYVWRVDGLAEGGDSPFYNFSRNGVRTYRVNITVSDGSAEAWHEWSVEVTSASPHVESGLPVWLIPAIVIIVAAIAIVLFVLWRRRRRAEGVTEEVLERRENGV